MPSSLKGLKKDKLNSTGIFHRDQLFFPHYHEIGASGETGDDETIDDQGADKLLAALKR